MATRLSLWIEHILDIKICTTFETFPCARLSDSLGSSDDILSEIVFTSRISHGVVSSYVLVHLSLSRNLNGVQKVTVTQDLNSHLAVLSDCSSLSLGTLYLI